MRPRGFFVPATVVLLATACGSAAPAVGTLAASSSVPTASSVTADRPMERPALVTPTTAARSTTSAPRRAPGTPGVTSRAPAVEDSFPPVDPDDPHRAVASRFVDAMMASARLPASATPVDRSPVASLDQGGGPSESPTLVNKVRWWISSAPPEQMVAYILEHVPAGARADGMNDLPTLHEVDVAWDPSRAYIWPQLKMTVVQHGPGSAIRVEALTLWIPSRTAAETIPGRITSVDVTLSFFGHTYKRTVPGKTAAPIAAALNALQPSAPVQVAGGSGDDTGFVDDLVFHCAGRDVLVELVIDGPGVGAYPSAGGTRQPLLGGYGSSGPPAKSVDLAIMKALGLPAGYRHL